MNVEYIPARDNWMEADLYMSNNESNWNEGPYYFKSPTFADLPPIH